MCFEPKRLLIFISLITCSFAFAQKPSNENITGTFFKNYKENPTKAYVDLFANNKWMKQSDVESVKIKLQDFLDGLGEYLGYELIAEKSTGESYLLKSFIIKYERQPLRFTFLLYKPKDSWQVQNFSYDTDIESELEEAAKAYRLKNNS